MAQIAGNPTATATASPSVALTIPPTVIMRRRGAVTEDDVRECAERMVEELKKEIVVEAVSDAMGDLMYPLLPWRHGADDWFLCHATERDAHKAEDDLLWHTVIDHLHGTGAFAAAIRHAVETVMIEAPAPQTEHVTRDEIKALVECSELCSAIEMPHLPTAEQVRIRLHVLSCEQCGALADVAGDVADEISRVVREGSQRT